MENILTQNLYVKKHANYFMRFLNMLPCRLASHDSTRVTIAFFAIAGLDVLNCLEMLGEDRIKKTIDWIYSYQLTSEPGELPYGGFQGSSTITIKGNKDLAKEYRWGHLAMTYTAIGTLIILGDDLSRINRESIIKGVEAVQREDGSFSASIQGSEHDMRFVYCAAAVCTMLNDWGNVNKDKMADYIIKSIRYDNGISQHFEAESHGGTTFCALAALQLCGKMDLLSPDVKEGMKRWLLYRQIDGFQGRPNKRVDTCYSFWIGASLKILDAFHLSDYNQNRNYILSTQDNVVGGFSKWPGSNTDPFHTYLGVCGLSFTGENGINEVMPSLNISMRAYERLKQIHSNWSSINNKNDEKQINNTEII